MTNRLSAVTPQTMRLYVVNAAAMKTVPSYDQTGHVDTAVVPVLGMHDCFATVEIHRRAIPHDALFQLYIEAWHNERGAASSISEMVLCKSHMRIIGMGAEIAVPLIFRKMADEGDEPDMWFVALQTLTGADPVTDEIRGDFKAMADRWLRWATDSGYVW